ncbi:S8 family serine peptidase [Streptomyces sp. A5-4]|uniref:S8 family serine peptidase n=1 Tax=Streptomyces sp. A5-4 TaxID=3384771 RepID=UPI003DA8306C
MTAGMSQQRRRSAPRARLRSLICTLALAGAWSIAVAGTAPVAAAADVQSKQWYLDAMQAKEMWKTTTGEGIKVAVIDSGVSPSTPSLRGQVLKGVDATETDGTTDDYSGHGTTMAELIAGTGKGAGLQGLAPGAKIIPVRVANGAFSGKRKVNAWDEEDAIRAAADSDARIISMSWSGEYMTAKGKEAVKYAQSKGKLFFAAAGNNAKEGNKAQYPAAYPEVVGVASADEKGTVAKYSQHGGNVHIASPGNNIPRWCDKELQSYCDGDGGTSAATAIASASAALVWSAHPDWTANQVLRVLFETAGRGWKTGTLSNYLGHGLIRPGQVILDGKGNPGAPDIDPLTDEKASSPSGSPAPSASQDSKGEPGSDTVVAGSSRTAGDDSQSGLILGAAAVAAVLALGAGAFVLVRRRRSI